MTLWYIDTNFISILIGILAIAISLVIVLVRTIIHILERLIKVETNVNIVVDWVKCLNGELSTTKEYNAFNKRLKDAGTKNGCNQHVTDLNDDKTK
jgi:hypothetical protein